MDAARFVVQEHTTPDGVHWDLMLEHGQTLLTFRVPHPPEQITTGPTPVTKIHDHSMRFLTYEGPVQNKTGRVRIADRGTYQIQSRTDAQIAFTLSGQVLRGSFTLTRLDGAEWTLTPQVIRS